jgi:hypothetical protein
MKRGLALAGAGVLFGAGAFGAFELLAHVRAKRTPASVSGAEVAAPSSDEPARQSTMRDLVEQAIATARVRAPSELDGYLAELESRARARGAVTALEIEPGLAAANDLGGAERAREFSARMRALQKELGPDAPAPRAGMPELEPTAANLSAALAGIAASSGDERGARVRQYIDATAGLPDEEQVARHIELNALLASDREHAEAADRLRTPELDGT